MDTCAYINTSMFAYISLIKVSVMGLAEDKFPCKNKFENLVCVIHGHKILKKISQ